ncbi:hypothetical protein M128_2231 [Bacteroides fragilis str. S6L8]|nr:hypothetical protein M130_2172 [Bacteroides fragilis str. S6R6]EYB00787.1 hypothetical protein M128_2231 [Bacteroides fragilis str. S6L8]EYB05444.1 hypothetical protein M129_2221 [Bacteroides fragilis str. S6R5]
MNTERVPFLSETMADWDMFRLRTWSYTFNIQLTGRYLSL